MVVAEMGDKTQLMTITIAEENQQPLFILMGTTVGMLIADGIGILGEHGCVSIYKIDIYNG
ncbi:putative Ca2+/H+ antiporter (TMEM165/GDT1 family) [Clostridium beijerinckii]|uniref:GDT1 family protein n=1 Tax=Clostridium beijerinckii TaxID=1520 RepID=A0AAX0AVK0_CLOBE|nr:putative Ca2+/H+ antiporter (TMEM165/GDT1 family) [Clostridium beijerinckii]NYC72403.1 putative Ca2+/H+ antiporter (TMEM165/GDT1 family) [Clostridium beijerinckii]